MHDIAAQARYEQFAELDRGPETFIMPNTWDGPSALLFKEAGFKSVATSSAAFAATLGRIDGIHAVSRDTHLDHAALLTSVSGLPVNGDFEDGYGENGETPPVRVVTASSCAAAVPTQSAAAAPGGRHARHHRHRGGHLEWDGGGPAGGTVPRRRRRLACRLSPSRRRRRCSSW